MRITAVAVLALVSSISLVACGDDSGGISIAKDRTTTTEADTGGDEGDDPATGDDADRQAFIDSMLSSGAPFDEDQAACVADETLGNISESGRETILSDENFDLTDLESDDSDVLIDALDTCVPIDDLAVEFVDQTVSEIGIELSDDEVACTADAFASEFSGTGEFMRSAAEGDTDAAVGQLFTAMGSCVSDETASTFFSASMANTSIPPDVAACIADDIVGQLGAEAFFQVFLEAGTGDGSELESLTAEAAVRCGAGDVSGDEIPVPSIGGGLGGQ